MTRTTGPAGGIRWIVGDIDPGSRGVAAGQTPAGGIVGADTQGKNGYGGICPPHGKSSTIEFVLYALSKKIPLSSGFAPTTAEREYGSGKLLLGQAAVTYASYRRPSSRQPRHDRKPAQLLRGDESERPDRHPGGIGVP